MKRIYLLAGIVATLFITWFLFFNTVTTTKQIAIPFSMYRCGEQLNKAAALAKWYLPFSENNNVIITDSGKLQVLKLNDYTIDIQEPTPFGAVIRSSKGKNSKLFSFTVGTDSGSVQSSIIKLTYKSPLFNQWFGKSELERDAEKSLESLNTYMTDTKRFYGFEIQFVTVEDTSFLFSRLTVPVTEKRSGIVKLFDKLIAFADNKKSGYNGTRILYTAVSGNEITLFAGIGVSTEVLTKVGDDIEYKRMPFGKNLLATSYQGPFGKSFKAFEALNLFKADQQLSSMAIPYQRIMSDGYDFSDEQMVQLKVYYPIF